MGRTGYNLRFLVDFPDLSESLEPIYSWGHLQIKENKIYLLQGVLELFDRIQALKACLDSKLEFFSQTLSQDFLAAFYVEGGIIDDQYVQGFFVGKLLVRNRLEGR